MRKKVQAFVESCGFTGFITGVIILNVIVLACEAQLSLDPVVNMQILKILGIVDNTCLGIYVVELTLRIYAYRLEFFKGGWNWFDFIIVAVSLIPYTGLPTQVVRILRVSRAIRAFRVFSGIYRLRIIVDALFESLPGIVSTLGLLLVVYFVYAIIGVDLYATIAPDYFGGIDVALFTLFQLTTLEGWPDVAHTIMAQEPVAWLYFVTFIVLAGFIIINVMIGVIVNALEEVSGGSRQQDVADEKQRDIEQTEEFTRQISEVKSQVADLQTSIDVIASKLK